MFIRNKLIPYLQSRAFSFQAGQICLYYKKWAEFTSDKKILQTVKGATIEFVKVPPIQMSIPHNSICKDHADLVKIEMLYNHLLRKRSLYFVNLKPRSFYRQFFQSLNQMVKFVSSCVNLKKFNQFVLNAHFKMDNIHTVLKLVRKDCWMASIDLKDAYYNVKIDQNFKILVR